MECDSKLTPISFGQSLNAGTLLEVMVAWEIASEASRDVIEDEISPSRRLYKPTDCRTRHSRHIESVEQIWRSGG